jgi:DNA polymerase-1
VRRVLFDLEGDGLLPELTRIHCICTVDVDTDETRDFGPGELRDAVAYLSAADVLIAHYGLGYDFPALAKVLGYVVAEARQLDTVVLARLKRPDIADQDDRWNAMRLKKGLPTLGKLRGKHSIEAWGMRLERPKLHVDITDWSQWTAEIQERCHGDVQTALALWKFLNPDTLPPAVVKLEHDVQRLTQRITEAGWPFDSKAAAALHVKLLEEKLGLEATLKKTFGGWYAPKTGGKAMVFTPKKDDAKKGYVAGAPFTKINWVTFEPSNRDHIKRCLLQAGWKPTEFTPSGKAKLDETILEGITALYPQAAPLTRYLLLDKRLGQLAEGSEAWLKAVTPQGRIHASYNPIGTVTFRATHFNPNISQVPSIDSPLGKECRSLFTVPPGWVMVGADMSGLEGRCLAHYLAKYDGGAYGAALTAADTHWAVAHTVGLGEGERDKDSRLHTIQRQGAKRLFYAMLYGAGSEKAGRIILETCLLADSEMDTDMVGKFFAGRSAPTQRVLQIVGKKAKEAVVEGIPGFPQLMRSLGSIVLRHERQWGHMALPGLGGYVLPIRSEHSALNSLLQSAGAILCKRWIVDAYNALIADGLRWGWEGDFVFLGWIHDELQVAARDGLGDRVGKLLTSQAREAGKPYGFRLALDSDYIIGRTWADCH